jgi:hypothetical protein
MDMKKNILLFKMFVNNSKDLPENLLCSKLEETSTKLRNQYRQSIFNEKRFWMLQTVSDKSGGQQASLEI